MWYISIRGRRFCRHGVAGIKSYAILKNELLPGQSDYLFPLIIDYRQAYLTFTLTQKIPLEYCPGFRLYTAGGSYWVSWALPVLLTDVFHACFLQRCPPSHKPYPNTAISIKIILDKIPYMEASDS